MVMTILHNHLFIKLFSIMCLLNFIIVIFSFRRLEVGQKLDEFLVVFLQVLVIQSSGIEGDSSYNNTPTLKSVRAQNTMYVVNIVQRCKLSGHVFISIHGSLWSWFLHVLMWRIRVSFHKIWILSISSI